MQKYLLILISLITFQSTQAQVIPVGGGVVGGLVGMLGGFVHYYYDYKEHQADTKNIPEPNIYKYIAVYGSAGFVVGAGGGYIVQQDRTIRALDNDNLSLRTDLQHERQEKEGLDQLRQTEAKQYNENIKKKSQEFKEAVQIITQERSQRVPRSQSIPDLEVEPIPANLKMISSGSEKIVQE